MLCTGRFYDFFEKRDGRWGLVLRQPIYEKDRLDPVDPAAKLVLDQDLLESFPEGYRHLAYLQSKIGYKVKKDMPGIEGPELDALYARGSALAQGPRRSDLASRAMISRIGAQRFGFQRRARGRYSLASGSRSS